jgi:hypothetical protein
MGESITKIGLVLGSRVCTTRTYLAQEDKCFDPHKECSSVLYTTSIGQTWKILATKI